MTQVLFILFGAGFTALVCYAAGMLVLGWSKAPLKRQEQHPLAFVVGAAILSLCVFLLGVVQALYWWVFLILGYAVIALAWRRRSILPIGPGFPALPAFERRLLWIVSAPFALLYFCYAMAPEMSPDGSTYHLGLVARYLRQHGFERITTHMYANLSQGVEMLYLFAFSFGKHSAAALVHFTFLMAAAWLMVNFGRRYGFPRAAVYGALFFWLSPVVGMDGSTAYNDVATAAILFTLFYLVRLWWDHPSDRLLALAGLVAGFCYAAKYTAAVPLPLVAAVVAWKGVRMRRWPVRELAIFGLCAALLITPWMVRNIVWLDNPVSPLFNKIFPNPYTHVAFEQAYRHQMRNYPGLESHWDIPLEVVLRGNVLCGLLGPLFFLTPVALLALRHRTGRLLWLAALVTGLPYLTNIGTRFLIPPLPYLALALAMVFVKVPRLAPALLVAHAVLSWPAAIPLYSDPHAWRIDGIRWRAALRLEPEEEYLRRKFPGYAVAQMVEEKVPPGERVLTFTQIPEAYTTRETLVVYQAAFNEVLGDMLWSPFNPSAQPTRRIRFEFDPQRLEQLRVIQTAESPTEHWSVSELRLFHDGKELEREPDWRLSARPNPWDVQRAFDNSLVTRWRTWEPLYEGMYVNVNLGEPSEVDAVVIACTADQWSIGLRLEGQSPSGEWKVLADSFEEEQVPAPPRMRRMVAEELKRAGVRYFLVHPTDLGKEDYQERPRSWGVSLLGEEHGIKLYRIN